MRKAFLYTSTVVIFSIIISIPVIIPYFHKGYFPTHDGEWAVVRLTDMFRELKDHQFPARYSGNLNLGFGYPLFNFAYPFPYYLGFILHFFRLGFVDSIKTLFAVSVPVSAAFMFFASRELWGNKLAGIISAAFYVYLPYRMVDLYVRGSIGESLSFILFPLILFLMIKISKQVNLIFYLAAAAFSYAMLITTHNIMAVFYSLVIFSFIVFFSTFENKKALRAYILFVFFGLLISAFFWIPAIFEKQYILLSQIPIADRSLYFVNFKQFLLPAWGYGVPTQIGGFSYQLGWPHVTVYMLTISAVAFYIFKKKEKNKYLKQALFISLVAAVIGFLLFRPSAFLWKLPVLSEINYPWTLLAPLGFLVSLLAGFLCANKVFRFFVFALVIVAILSFLPYANPKVYFDKGDSYYLTNDATTTSSQELMPLWVKDYPSKRFTNKVEIINGQGTVRNVNYNSRRINFLAQLSSPGTIRINTIYYPGWTVLINGQKTNLSYLNDKGVIDINVPAGADLINAQFSETPLRAFSNLLSLTSCLLIFITVLFRKRFKFLVN